MTETADIIIVGGGLGGLAAAVRLAHGGKKVTLFEKNDRLGGKCDRVSWEGFHFDTGPSLLSMPFVLEGIFTECDRDWRDYLTISRVEAPACKYFFPDGSEFIVPDSMEKLREEIATHFPSELAGFDRFIAYAHSLYQISAPMFLFAPFSIRTIFKTPFRTLLKGLGALLPGTMDRVIHRYFKDPKLIQLLRRYATYNGSDPARTPHTFSVIPYVEWQFGAWHIEGGMYGMVQALEKLAKEFGVDIHLNEEVREVLVDSKMRICGVDTSRRKEYLASHVVCNQDALTAHHALFSKIPSLAKKSHVLAKKETSVSGFVLLAALKNKNPALAYHNVFFCEDYPSEFKQIFGTPQPLSDPTIYISIPSKMDDRLAPEGSDSWFVLVNAPPLDRFSKWDAQGYENFLIDGLESKVPHFLKDDVLWTRHHTPNFFANRYSAWQGSLYGNSSNSLIDSFFRVKNQSTVKGLYFCGGSAHPGGGIPLVLSSGKIVADLILKK